MNTARALGLLRRLGPPAFTTADAAAACGQRIGAASKTLQRLRAAGLVHFVRKGLWTLHDDLEPLVLVEYLTAPHPSYASLQTALYLHGMVDQIPSVFYVVSLTRSHRIGTSLGTFSVHRIAPAFFGGFEVSPHSGAKIATPEKALLDVFYLSAGRSRLFASLPEIELPAGFRHDYARAWTARIPSARLRTLVARRLQGLAEIWHGREVHRVIEESQK
ncbi:MAG: type IV toxin-antitoxin system AbiEi family antitoxin [Candidatus Latescibacterota bacterium]